MDYAVHYDHPHDPPNPNCCACFRELEKAAQTVANSRKATEQALVEALKENQELRAQLAAPKEYQQWVTEARVEGYAQAHADVGVKIVQAVEPYVRELAALRDSYDKLVSSLEAKQQAVLQDEHDKLVERHNRLWSAAYAALFQLEAEEYTWARESLREFFS